MAFLPAKLAELGIAIPKNDPFLIINAASREQLVVILLYVNQELSRLADKPSLNSIEYAHKNRLTQQLSAVQQHPIFSKVIAPQPTTHIISTAQPPAPPCCSYL